MPTTIRLWSLFVIFGFLDKGASNPCEYITVRMNQNVTIKCPVPVKAERYYWYLGSSSETKPILALDNGEKSGAKYKDEHYSITSEGEMEIINAQMEHQGTYTLVVILPNRTSLKQDIEVHVRGLAVPCRLKYSLKIGHNLTVSCEVDGGDIDQYQWYREPISDKRPLLTLHNGVKGGLMYHDNHYAITDKGELQILDAKEEHEGHYTIVIVFKNGTEGDQTILLEIVDVLPASITELWTIVLIVLVVFTISTIILATITYIISKCCNRKAGRSGEKGKVETNRGSTRNRSKNNYSELQKMVAHSKGKLNCDVQPGNTDTIGSSHSTA